MDATAVTYAIFVTLAMRPVGAAVFRAARRPFRPAAHPDVQRRVFLRHGAAQRSRPFAGTWFLVLRALFGFGMGGEWGIGSSLVMESVPAGTRGVLSGILQQGYPVGYLLAALAYKFAFPMLGWRGMFFLGFARGLLVLYIRQSVDESPAWQEAHRSRARRTSPGVGGGAAARLAGADRALALAALSRLADGSVQFLQSRHAGPLSQRLAGRAARPLAGHGQQHRHRL